jgi:hypothetical protein
LETYHLSIAEEIMSDTLKTDFFTTYGDLLYAMNMETEDTPMNDNGPLREQPRHELSRAQPLGDPYENYRQLTSTLYILESYDIFTEDWKDEQKCMIGEYSELVHFIKSSDKMKDGRYRKRVEEMEEALDQVIDCLLKYDDIELNFYTDFVKAMIKVYEFELDIDILCDQMSSM